MLLPAATQVQRTASGLSVPVSDCGSVPDLARARSQTISLGIGPTVTVCAADLALPSYPSLPCGPAGDAEPVSDLGPGVALGAQALDRLADGVVQLAHEPGHEAECFDVAVCDAAAVGAQDAPDELAVLDGPPRSFW